MNERMQATIVCCAKLADGVTPPEKARSFYDNVMRATGLTRQGINANSVISHILDEIYRHGNVDAALHNVGL